MTFHSLFWPQQSADYGDAPDIQLTDHTPRGLFMGSGRNKYLVCDGVDDRFAIVLAHESIAQFKRISLGSQPLDEGALCGLGTVHLGKLSPDINDLSGRE